MKFASPSQRPLQRVNKLSNTRTNADERVLTRIYSQPEFPGSLYTNALHEGVKINRGELLVLKHQVKDIKVSNLTQETQGVPLEQRPRL